MKEAPACGGRVVMGISHGPSELRLTSDCLRKHPSIYSEPCSPYAAESQDTPYLLRKYSIYFKVSYLDI
jgi:hypothetical protein